MSFSIQIKMSNMSPDLVLTEYKEEMKRRWCHTTLLRTSILEYPSSPSVSCKASSELKRNRWLLKAIWIFREINMTMVGRW